MAQHLTNFQPIPIPTDPARLPSLPAWLLQRSAALENVVQPDSSGKYRPMPTLPKAMILSSSELSSVEQHIASLERFTRLDQMIELRGRTLTNPEAHAVEIAALLLKGVPKLDQDSSDALTDDYLDAIEDLPAWSVREALRKWNRGESRSLDAKPHNYDFRPSPPTLRRLALVEVAVVRNRILKLRKLCNAQPLIEYGIEHRQEMIRRLAAVFRDCRPGRP